MIGEFEKYMPAPEVIKMDFPNPCGWCTGMEDGCITGGVMLESAISAYECSGNKKYLEKVADIFEGLKKCASASADRGFLVRNFSPLDGKTYYSNSSRDQYTHWISACCIYYQSGLCSDEDKAFIRKALCDFAARAEQNVNEKTGWNLLDEKGRRGLVMTMWGDIMPHEFMRLPMIYIAAWKIGGDEHYRDLYLKYRDIALEKSEEIDFSVLPRPFAVNQMLLSFKTAYTLDDDNGFKQRALILMKRLAGYGYDKVMKYIKEDFTAENLKDFLDCPQPWDKIPAVAELEDVCDGFAYYVPLHYKSLHSGARKHGWIVRDMGDALSIYMNCPGTVIDDKIVNAFRQVEALIDPDKHFSDALSTLLFPYIIFIKKSKN